MRRSARCQQLAAKAPRQALAALEAEGIRDFQEIVSAGISDAYLRWKGIDATLGLRVREDEERLGLDATQHGELAYTI